MSRVPCIYNTEKEKQRNSSRVKTRCPWEQLKANNFQLWLLLFTPWYKNGCSGKGKAKTHRRQAALPCWEVSIRISSKTVPTGLCCSSLLQIWECPVLWVLLFCPPPFNCWTLNQDSSQLPQWSWIFVNTGFDHITCSLISQVASSVVSARFCKHPVGWFFAIYLLLLDLPLTVYLDFAWCMINKLI